MSSTSDAPTSAQTILNRGFIEWLVGAGGTVFFTTYDPGMVVMVSWDGSQVRILHRIFNRPMGIAAASPYLWLATHSEVLRFADAPALAPTSIPGEPSGFDALFLPRVRYETGDVDAHDLALGWGGPWLISTRYNSIVRISDRYNFEPVWRPPFVTADGPYDRCHLNGLAMVNGQPGFVTAFGVTNELEGWRQEIFTGGVVVAVADGTVRVRGMCMPHSPRWHNGRLWVLNSGLGELWVVDSATGRHDVVCGVPAYVRGLAFVGDYALVGMCLSRRKQHIAGLPVEQKYSQLKCGVALIDLRSGTVVGELEFTSGCREVFDIGFMPRVRHPMLQALDDPAKLSAVATPGFSLWAWRKE